MSFDLYIWHERAPITAVEAAAKVAAWNAGDDRVFVAHFSVPLLRAELLARFPPGRDDDRADGPGMCTPRDAPPHHGTGSDERRAAPGVGDGAGRDGADAYGAGIGVSPGASVLGLSVVPALAGVVADAARHGAKRHGLICYDPREQLVDPNAPGAPSFTLSSARLAPVPDPDEALLELTVRGLSADNFFVVLERSDGWFVQVGVGRRAVAADDTYALEFQDGTPEGHFRCETTDLAQAARLLREFRAGDDRWRHRHPWRPLQW